MERTWELISVCNRQNKCVVSDISFVCEIVKVFNNNNLQKIKPCISKINMLSLL